jgi:hypothetical protein
MEAKNQNLVRPGFIPGNHGFSNPEFRKQYVLDLGLAEQKSKKWKTGSRFGGSKLEGSGPPPS